MSAYTILRAKPVRSVPTQLAVIDALFDVTRVIKVYKEDEAVKIKMNAFSEYIDVHLIRFARIYLELMAANAQKDIWDLTRVENATTLTSVHLKFPCVKKINNNALIHLVHIIVNVKKDFVK